MKPHLKIDDRGNKIYHIEGDILHREDGPAIEYKDGSKVWSVNGKYHREDGPAMEFVSSNMFPGGLKLWYYKGHDVQCDNFEYFKHYIKLKAFW